MSVRKAQELQGGNHCVFGTQQYVEALNKASHLSTYLLPNSASYQYYEAIQNTCKQIHQAISEIIEDLERNQNYLFQLSKDNLNRTLQFLNGLDSFLSLTTSSSSKVHKYTELLTKISSPAFRSRASQKELQTAYDKLKHRRYQTNLSERQQKELIEKAARNGIRYTANGNPDILKFLQEVAGHYDKEFFSDLLSFEERALLQAKKPIGKRGKPLCSAEYIQQYETIIFHGNLSQKHLNGKFSYGDFLKDALTKTRVTIQNDFSRRKLGHHIISAENRQRILAVAENLKKCGFAFIRFQEDLDKFNLPDITDALNRKMKEALLDAKRIQREAKQEAKALVSKKYPSLSRTAQVRAKDFTMYTSKSSYFVWYHLILLWKFSRLVGGGCKYDLKSQGGIWKSESGYFLFDGNIIEFDAPGNILYGVMVKEVLNNLGKDSPEIIGHAGAGVVQIYDNIIEPILMNMEDQNYKGRPNWDVLKYAETLFDDPRDYRAVEFGYNYYDHNQGRIYEYRIKYLDGIKNSSR